MTRLIKFLLALSLLPLSIAWGQNTTITATVVDSAGTVWANAPYTLSFRVNPSQPNQNVYNINGVPLNPALLQYSGYTNGSGVLSQAVYQNTAISPSGSQWSLQICPLSSAGTCGAANFSASGSTMNVSTAINAAITAPRFPALAGAYGYTDSEAQITLPVGATYWNVTLQSQRYWNGSAWNAGGLPAGISCSGSPLVCTISGNLNVTGNVAAGATVSMPTVIFSNDFGGSLDGAGALAILANAANQGIINLGAVISVDLNPCGVNFASTILEYYSMGSTPTAWMPNYAATPVDSWCAGIPAAFPYNATPVDAVSLMRTVLAQNRNVIWVEDAPPVDLAALATSGPDQISQLTGAQLITQSISKIVEMGGDYPSSTTEYNLHNVPSASQTVTALGVPIVWAGYSIGCPILTGQGLYLQQTYNPVAQAYAAVGFSNESCDMLAAQYAIWGTSYGSTTYFGLTASGYNAINSAGDNTFEAGNAPNNQHYMTLVATSTQEQTLLNTLLDAAPFSTVERLNPNPVVAPTGILGGNTVVTQFNPIPAGHIVKFYGGQSIEDGFLTSNANQAGSLAIAQLNDSSQGDIPIFYPCPLCSGAHPANGFLTRSGATLANGVLKASGSNLNGDTSGNTQGVIGTASVTATLNGNPFAAMVLSTNGTAGSTSYSYEEVCYIGTGIVTSPVGTITTGNSALSSTNSVNVHTAVAEVSCPIATIYRTATVGSYTKGIIGLVSTGATFIDTGIVGDGSTAPTASQNTTGTFTAGTSISAPQHCIGSSCITAWPSGVTNVTFTTSTASVAANTCNATVQVAMSGVTTSMAFSITPTADTSSATGWGSTGGLVLDTWPTVGYLNYKICNQTTAAISSPGAVTFNASAR